MGIDPISLAVIGGLASGGIGQLGKLAGGGGKPPPLPGASPIPPPMGQQQQTPQFNFGSTISPSPGAIGVGAPSPEDPNDILRRLLRGRI